MPPGLALANRMAPKRQPEKKAGRRAGREGELQYRFVRSRLGPRHGGEDKDQRTQARPRVLVRAPRVGARGDAQAFGPWARGAACRLSCMLWLRAGRPQLRAAGGDRVAAFQGDQGLEDRDAARKRAQRSLVVNLS